MRKTGSLFFVAQMKKKWHRFGSRNFSLAT